MPIEFRCSRCGKLLRTGDGTAGRQAQCPECGTITTVPGLPGLPEAMIPTLAPLGSEGSSAAGGAAGSPFGPGAAPAGSPDAPYQSPSPPGYQLPPGQVYAHAVQRVSAPATALMVIGWLGTILSALLALLMFAGLVAVASDVPLKGGGPMQGEERMQAIVVCSSYLIAGIVGTAMGVLILIGARKMKTLQSYNLAMTAAIVAVIPCISPCGLLGLPFGIWALVVLGDSSVKAAFRS